MRKGVRILLCLAYAYTAQAQFATIGNPRMPYATYFGGSGAEIDELVSIYQPTGEIFVAGTTSSSTLPNTAGTYQPRKAQGLPDSTDIFIAKLDPTGKSVIWSTFLGGSGSDSVVAIAVDPSGNVFLVGHSNSVDFPQTTGAWRASGARTPLLAKISSDGRSLLFSTRIGDVQPLHLAAAPDGSVVLTGIAFSVVGGAGLPPHPDLLGSRLPSPHPGALFVARFNSGATSPPSAAYLGDGFSKPSGLAVDGAGDVYVYGTTFVSGLPLPASAYQPQFSNVGLGSDGTNGFIFKVSRTLDRLSWGTYFGPRFATTSLQSLAVDNAGNVHFAGSINTSGLPLAGDSFQRQPATGYFASLSGNGSTLSYSTYVTLPRHQSASAYDFRNRILHVAEERRHRVYNLATKATMELAQPFTPSSVSLTANGAAWIGGLARQGSTGATNDALQRSVAGSSDVALSAIQFNRAGVSVAVGAAHSGVGITCGQLVSLYGQELGPAAGAAATIENGLFPTILAGTRVLIGPDATPAPLLYVGESQVNTAIPHALCAQGAVDLILERDGARVSTTKLTLAPTAPALFTTSGGTGQVAALNQDGTVNSATNPAARGTVVTLFLTGAGAMTGSWVDGGIAQDASVRVSGRVTALFGSFDSGEVLYAGAAPGLVFGVVQINVRISTSAPVGPATAIRVRVGDATSPGGVTIAIQ